MLQTIKMKQLHFKQLGIAILSTSSDFTEAIRETTRKLENFYMDIAYKAQDEWPQQPQVQSFDVNQGEVRLSFYCKGDTIPWAFVKNIAERLWESAALGLADLFEVIYSDDTGTVSVMIVLDVINRSSDGSTSGSGLREGSVPSITSPKD